MRAQMQKSQSDTILAASTLRYRATKDWPLAAGATRRLPGVSLDGLFRFVFPAWLENPDSVGRLELFAQFGPADEEGYLRGGFGGMHRHTDLEINQMASHSCMEAVYDIAFAGKQRCTVEVVARNLHHAAMKQRYGQDQVRELLSRLPVQNDRMSFSDLQRTVLASQRRRLLELRRRGENGLSLEAPKERPPHVPFQSTQAKELMMVTLQKKVGKQEEATASSKRLHNYMTVCGGLEQQQCTVDLQSNVVLIRPPASVDDRWDRYCALRRVGRSSYVGARNNGKFNATMDEGLSDKHPGASSLISAFAGGSSASVQLAS